MKSLIALLIALFSVSLLQPAHAARLETLLHFNGTNGALPTGRLLRDKSGVLYGVTPDGGQSNFGTIYSLTPPPAGKTAWTHKIIYKFSQEASPTGHLIMDKSGNLYGTTSKGGAAQLGTVFRLSPPAAGKVNWTFKTLVTFKGRNGATPLGGLVMDGAGQLYGTTKYGGYSGVGTIFRLSPPAPGKTAWTLKTLYEADYINTTGSGVGLLRDRAGNLYGTSYIDGKYGKGSVFQLKPPAPGKTKWTYKVLVSFNEKNGAYPEANLIMDSAGILYGTTSDGGTSKNCISGCGVVFSLSPPAAGKTNWSLKTLVNFDDRNGDYPGTGLVMDKAGNIFGTMEDGGANDYGTVFKLTRPASGQSNWTLTTLINFNYTDGWNAEGGMVMDGSGNLYGTTAYGGASDACGGNRCGTVFKVTP